MLLAEKKMEALVDENPKVAIGHKYRSLGPAALRSNSENDNLLHKSTLGKDWQTFYENVLEKTMALDEFLPAIEKTASGSRALAGASCDKTYPGHKSNRVCNRKSHSGGTDKASLRAEYTLLSATSLAHS